jgi:hypothetical protein
VVAEEPNRSPHVRRSIATFALPGPMRGLRVDPPHGGIFEIEHGAAHRQRP